jgi:scyllo-inositol 2-dehydrogenase (NADP+)
MPSKSPIKVGVIGLGRAGWDIHVSRMRGDARFQVTAVADWLPDRLKQAADEFGCATFKDHKALLKSADADIVVVASFSDTHPAITKDVLKAGYHAVCEKPIANSVAQAKSMIATAAQTGQTLLVHHNYRFALEVRYLLDLIKSKRIGEVFEVRMRAFGFGRRWDWQTMRKHYGGVLNNTCPHYLDIGLQVLGAPVKDLFCDLKQLISPGDVEDHVKVLLRGENGRVYDMEVSSVCKFNEPKWTLLGTLGTAVSDGMTTKLEWINPKASSKIKQIETPLPGRIYCNDTGLEWHSAEEPTQGPSIGDFYDNVWAVLREGRKPVVTLEQALEVVRVTQACKKMSGYY